MKKEIKHIATKTANEEAVKPAGKRLRGSVTGSRIPPTAPVPAIANEADYNSLMARIEQMVVAGGGTMKT